MIAWPSSRGARRIVVRWPTSANVQKTHNTSFKLLCCGFSGRWHFCVTVVCVVLWVRPQHNSSILLCCLLKTVVLWKSQHSSFKSLCCGFSERWHFWVTVVYGKPTTQQLKTIVLWVFWALALVGHRIVAYTPTDWLTVSPRDSERHEHDATDSRLPTTLLFEFDVILLPTRIPQRTCRLSILFRLAFPIARYRNFLAVLRIGESGCINIPRRPSSSCSANYYGSADFNRM